MKKNFFHFSLTLLLLVILEGIARLFGVSPYPHYDSKVVEEAFKNFKGYMCADSIVGYKPCGDNTTRKIPQNDCIMFEVTHLSDGSRYCGESTVISPKILITGDSNTHGDGVNDNEHLGYFLQSKLNEYKVINSSIPGSGTLAQFLTLKQFYKEDKDIEIVVATYASYHDHRNTFSRSRKKQFPIAESVKDMIKFPSAKLKNNYTYEISLEKHTYMPVPFSNFSSLMESFNLLIEHIDFKVKKSEKVTDLIIEDYIKFCKQNNIRLIFQILNEGKRSDYIAEKLLQENIEFIRINFTDEMKLLPCDNHPNILGHQYMAEELANVIRN